MSEYRYKVRVVTESIHDPEVFANVLKPEIADGFLFIEGLWDTYLISTSVIREIRITEDEEVLNYTASEYLAEIRRLRQQRDNTARNTIIAAAHAAINALEEFVEINAGMEHEVELANRVLGANGFTLVRVSDIGGSGKVKYRIKAEGD